MDTGARGGSVRCWPGLDRSFRLRRDLAGLTWVTSLRVAIPDQPVAVLVGAAETLSEVGRYDRAAAVLEEVSARPDLPQDTAGQLRTQALALRARLN